MIGRKKEIERLNELYNSKEAELVALYGRRRVGKTYLIDETLGDRLVFRHSGLSPVETENDMLKGGEQRMKAQLVHFHRSLVLYGAKDAKEPKSWLEAFYMLEDLLMSREKKEKRQVLFFDEIQWLDTPRSGFMTGFEAFWNGWACHRKNIMVVVCGSSSSWILNSLVNNHGGLYGRVTCEIKLSPFSLRECEEYFNSKGICMSRYDMVQAYMAVGGIPYYLQYFVKTYSLAQNISNLFFTKTSPLRDEFDRLFSSLFVNPEVMKALVCALAAKNRGLTRKEISEVLGTANSGELTKQLNALISGDFVVRYVSFGNSKREAFYKLIDPFCLFWLRFVKDNKDSRKNWINLENTAKVTAWKGYAFENVCWNHTEQIKAALGISGVVTEESLWSKRGDEDSEGVQIDLIINRKDNVLNMCEIKFYNDEFAVDKDYHFVLERRKRLLYEIIPKRTSIHSTLITTYGLKYNEYSGDFINIITLEDLFV